MAGQVRVVLAGRELDHRVLRATVAQRVLAVLALEQRSVSRDELGDAVWGEELPRTWETALRGAVSQLRKAAAEVHPSGEHIVRTAFGAYQLDPAARVDVVTAVGRLDEAEAALAAGDGDRAGAAIEPAVRVLTQVLLPGLEGEWLEEQRRRLRLLAVRALLVDSAAATARGLHRRAVDAAGAAVELDPLLEATHRQLMAAHAAAGDRAAAAMAYRRCRDVLASELGVDPSELTEATHRTAVTSSSLVAPLGLPESLLAALPLAGRVDELAVLTERWARVRDGGSGAAVVLGAAGVGKSRLAAEVAGLAHADGAVVLHGRFDLDDLGAFGAFAEVFGQLGIAWPPPEVSGGAGGGRSVLFDEAVRALRRAARDRRTVVVLDDAHWADRPSLALLGHLADATPPGVLIVATARDDWLPPPLAEVVERTTTVRLAPLAVDEVHGLLTSWAGTSPSTATLERIHRQSGGNPFFITALLQDLVDRGDIDLRTGLEGAGDLTAVASTVAGLVADAVDRCGPAGPEIALAAAVLGAEFRPEVLTEVAGHPAGVVVATLERMVHARLVGHVGQDAGRFQFVHALVRQSLLDGADAGALRSVHRRAVLALDTPGATGSLELLRHLLAARDDATRGRACDVAARVAEDLVERGAPEEAIELLTGLVAWMDAAGETATASRSAVLLSLSIAEMSVDRLPQARAHLHEAARIAVDLGDPSTFGAGLMLARPPTDAEYDQEAVDLAARLLALAPPGSRLAVGVRCWLAAELTPREPERAAALVTSSLEEAKQLEDPLLLRLATIAWHLLARPFTDPVARRDELQALLAIRSPLGKRSADLTAGVFLAGDLLELGERAEAERVIEDVAAATAQFGPVHVRWIALRNLIMLRALAGRFDEADELAEQSLAVAGALPIPEAVTLPVLQQILTRYHQGRLAELHPLVVAFSSMAPAHSPVPVVRAWMEVELGDPGAAASVDAAVDAALTMPRSPFSQGVTALALEAAARMRHACTDELAARLEPHAGRHVVIVTMAYLGAVDRYLGLAALARGDEHAARTLLGRAVGQHRDIGALPYLARSERELGALG